MQLDDQSAAWARKLLEQSIKITDSPRALEIATAMMPADALEQEIDDTELLLRLGHSKFQDALFVALGDTSLETPLEDFYKITAAAGFERVWAEPFNEPQTELTGLMFRRPGLVLWYDTYNGCLSSLRLFSNFQCDDNARAHTFVENGGMSSVPNVWHNTFEGPAGLLRHLTKLQDMTLLEKWVARPVYFYLHNRQKFALPGYDPQRENGAIAALLPPHVQEVIAAALYPASKR